jgi:hypothetical protein
MKLFEQSPFAPRLFRVAHARGSKVRLWRESLRSSPGATPADAALIGAAPVLFVIK